LNEAVTVNIRIPIKLNTVPGKNSNDLCPGTLDKYLAARSKRCPIPERKQRLTFKVLSDLTGMCFTGATREEASKNMRSFARIPQFLAA